MALSENERKIMNEIYSDANLKPSFIQPLEFPKLPKKSLIKPRAMGLKTTSKDKL